MHVEEKQVAEIKKKVQTVRNSLGLMNSSINQTQNIRGCVNGRRDERCVNGYRGDECQNHAHAETKSSGSRQARGDFATADGKENQGRDSKRTSRLGQTHQSEIDWKDQERAKHRDKNETNKAKIETKKGFGEAMPYSKKHLHEGGQGQVTTKAGLC